MADPLPPDPYLALGVAKDATAAAIKTQYRKLALKFHPDKVKDESAKAEATDNFHKIQSAWDIIGDEVKRSRYDAEVRLKELRKDIFHGHGGHGGHGERRSSPPDVRTASYKMPTDAPRGGDFYTRGPDRYGPGPKVSPQYEERRPSYASDEYFEEPPRPTSRKHDDYERTTKRAPPREDRERPRAEKSRENERSSRKEKSRRTDQGVRRDRDRKQAYVEVQEEYESDGYRGPLRTPPEDEGLQRARENFFADTYTREVPGTYDERTRKSVQQFEEAKAHMERSRGANRQREESAPREPSPRERRPSPVRMSSSKDKVERTKRADVKTSIFGVRHGSGERPKASRTKTDKEQKSSDEDRRNARRKDETRDSKAPPLKSSKSSPPEAQARPPYTRQRSSSMQEQHTEEQPIPSFKRSETMPQSPSAAAPPPRDSRHRDNSRLHPDSASYPTPDPTPEPEPMKYRYGKNQAYADDGDFIPTPDGFVNADSYRTQEYVPSRETGRQSTREASRNQRFSASPEPMKDNERQGRRSSAARHTSNKPSMTRTTSTQYVVEPEGNSYVRPAPSRENSGREQMRTRSRENSGRGNLYGEIRTSSGVRSGSPRRDYTFAPPEVKYAKQYKGEDIKAQSGYSTRRDDKPHFPRTSSGLRGQAVYA